MRNALVRKKLLLVCFVLAYNSNAFGQHYKEMFVPLIAQETNSWCWAAAIEMIMDFHNPAEEATTQQCSFVSKYRQLANLSPNSCCGSTGCNGSTMPFSIDGNPPTLRADFVDLVFSSLGYNSTQEINRIAAPISWMQIKQEITACRPFILFIKGDATDPDAPRTQDGSVWKANNHVIVVKGYYEDKSTGNKYLITNDSWITGSGDESAFPYEIFSNYGLSYTTPAGLPVGSYLVYSVLAVVHDIHPDTVFTDKYSNCISCDFLTARYAAMPTPRAYSTDTLTPDILTSASGNNFSLFTTDTILSPKTIEPGFTKALVQNAERIVGFQKNRLNVREYGELIKNKYYHDAPIKYINYQKLNEPSIVPTRRLNKVITSTEQVVEVVSEASGQEFVSTFQKINDEWVLRKISTRSQVKKSLNVLVLSINRRVLLSNKIGEGALIEPHLNYELIKYPPFPYEFYSFNLLPGDTRYYLAPVQNYDDLGIKAGNAYKEGEILDLLRSTSKIYEDQITGLKSDQGDQK